jgi:hypothetical protein
MARSLSKGNHSIAIYRQSFGEGYSTGLDPQPTRFGLL